MNEDVIVVGGGAIGVACAYELVQRGASVVVIESGDVPGFACSYGNAGLISPSHCIPLARPGIARRIPGWLRPGGSVYVKPRASVSFARFGVSLLRSSGEERMLAGLRVLRDLSRVSQACFEELARAGLAFGYRRAGVMNVAATKAGFAELVADAELLEREGFDPELLDATQAGALEPLLRDDVAGAVHWAEDAHCDPADYVAEVARAAEASGVRFELGVRASRLVRGADGSVARVDTSDGSFRAPTVVLAAGAWTAALARTAGSSIPLEPGRGYHVHAPSGPRLQMPLIFHEHVFAATPLGDGLRLAGTMDFVGLDLRYDESRARRLADDASRYLRELGTLSGSSTWCGLRPCTPDSLPIVGRSGRVPNLILATGHGMLGLTLAPVTGVAVAQLVTGEPASAPVDALSPARFGA